MKPRGACAMRAVLCALCLAMVLSGCDRFFPRSLLKSAQAVRIPQNHMLAWYPRYLVSNDDYSRLLAEKNEGAQVISIIRRGDVLRILDIDGQNTEGFVWYKVRLVQEAVKEGEEVTQREGWVLLLRAVRVYSLEKAWHTSRKLKRRVHVNRDGAQE